VTVAIVLIMIVLAVLILVFMLALVLRRMPKKRPDNPELLGNSCPVLHNLAYSFPTFSTSTKSLALFRLKQHHHSLESILKLFCAGSHFGRFEGLILKTTKRYLGWII